MALLAVQVAELVVPQQVAQVINLHQAALHLTDSRVETVLVHQVELAAAVEQVVLVQMQAVAQAVRLALV